MCPIPRLELELHVIPIPIPELGLELELKFMELELESKITKMCWIGIGIETSGIKIDIPELDPSLVMSKQWSYSC